MRRNDLYALIALVFTLGLVTGLTLFAVLERLA